MDYASIILRIGNKIIENYLRIIGKKNSYKHRTRFVSSLAKGLVTSLQVLGFVPTAEILQSNQIAEYTITT